MKNQKIKTALYIPFICGSIFLAACNHGSDKKDANGNIVTDSATYSGATRSTTSIDSIKTPMPPDTIKRTPNNM